MRDQYGLEPNPNPGEHPEFLFVMGKLAGSVDGLREEVKQLRNDISGGLTKMNDRVSVLEKAHARLTGQAAVLAFLAGIGGAIVVAIVVWLIKGA